MSYRKEDYKAYVGTRITNQSGISFDKFSSNELTELWKETLKKGVHGLCFSLYEEGQKPGDIISKSQVERRIKIIKPYTKWVRSFSCLEGNEHIPQIAKKHGLKTMVGAWLGKNKEENKREIDALIQLGQNENIDIAAVGNEVLYRDDFSLDELLKYIQEVKKALPNIPVGYVDAYYEFSRHPELVKNCDIILSNCYPFWEGCDLNNSLNHMQHMYHQTKQAGLGKKVIITETGWPNKGKYVKGAIPSDEFAMKYFINSQVWAHKENIEMFYFSSFDESWKIGVEGDVGAFWGIWDKNEKLKF